MESNKTDSGTACQHASCAAKKDTTPKCVNSRSTKRTDGDSEELGEFSVKKKTINILMKPSFTQKPLVSKQR